MKILRNSLLLFRINTNKDTVKCVFLFWIGWFQFKKETITFDLNKLSMLQIIEFHKQLSNEWNRKYRV